ncbi:Vms1/Ankzf1 family peptidyl-tRNA hydrolase [Terrabacter sp. NPDC080008]|uniref:baeRF2 domain-containing protein n=1 Tax=Terrabacter sp. NPDC080008 TaxID=3155176 RepID=UPI00344DB95B
MKLDLFHDLAEENGPFASVTFDETRTDPANADRLDARWRDVADRLRDAGAPEEVVASLAEAALEPTGRGGQWGRLLVANADGLLLRHDLPRRPDQDVSWGPVPSLLHAIRALASCLPHVVVRVDHIGADIEVNGGISGSEEELEVQGDHDVLHRFKGGGWSHRRFQERVHDSWEHNAATVAQRLDGIVRHYRPQVIVLMGDERAMTFLEQHVGEETKALIVRSDTGGRAEGTDEEKERLAIEAVLAATRAQAEADLVARFEEQTGRAEAATEGLAPVVEVLQRAQAEELILVEGREHDDQLWVGEGRLQLGTSREDAEMTGAEQPAQVPADAALVWAAVCSRAAVTLVDRAQLNPADGVGAVLRWSDESTPRARVPSVPGHGGT